MSILWYESFAEQLYAEAGIPFEIRDGKALSECAETFPDIYFSFDYKWLQVRPDDYIRRESATVCSLKIRPIEAPFNIMGMPAYIGYYFTHDWGKDSAELRIAPHIDSNNRPLEEMKFNLEAQQFKIKYQSENTPNGDFWALATALFIAIVASVFLAYSIYTAN